MDAVANVLLVDDEPAVLRGYQRLLVSSGLRVECATSANGALKLLADGHVFDAILSDVNLPGLSGLEFISALRAHDPVVPVVLITGNPQLEGAALARERGAYGYLAKPVSAETLVRTVLRAVGARGPGSRAMRAVVDGAELRRALRVSFSPIACASERARVRFESANLTLGRPGFSSTKTVIELATQLGETSAITRLIIDVVAARVRTLDASTSVLIPLPSAALFDAVLTDPLGPIATLAPRIVLELKDPEALRDRDLVSRVAALRAQGYRLGLEDLTHVNDPSYDGLSPSFVRVEAALVRGAAESERRRKVLRALLEMCRRDLSVQVVCDGVDSKAIFDTVVACGGDLLGGSYIGDPVPRPAPL